MNIAKKIFAVATSSLMIVASVASFASYAHAAVHATGTNVVSNGTVYFLDGTSKRPYTSAGAFLSYGFNSWGNVVAASAEDLALPTGAYVPPMDGSLINDKGTVYLITGGQRAGFTSAANFLGLGYSFSNVIPGDTSFMTSAPLISSTSVAHPAGTLVNDAGTVYLMTSTGKQGIPSLSVFNSWGYSFSKVVPANSYDHATGMSAGIMPAYSAGCLSPLSCTSGTTTPPVVTGNVSVSLASDTAMSGSTIVAGQAAAPLASFVFNGSGTVTSLTFTRIGVSNNSAVDNVYLYQGNTRLTDGSSLTSSNTVTFNNANGLFNVNGSTEITVRADIDNNSSNIAAGQSIGLQLTSGMTGTTAIAGAPVSANLSTVAIPTNLAHVYIDTTSVTPTSGATVNAGTSNFVVWHASAQVSQHSVNLASASFQYMGSASTSAFQNWGLYIDGSQVATSSGVNANNYVTFIPTSSVSLTTGTHTIEVHTDIVGGSSRSIQMTLQNGSDLLLTDTNYNVNVTPVSGTSSNATSFVPVSASSVSINNGTLSISLDPSFNTTTNIPAGATSQVIASYQLQAYGENVKINNLTVTPVVTNGKDASNNSLSGLQNVTMFLNGSQVGSSQNWSGTGSLTYTFGSQLVVPASSTPSILQIKADLQTSNGTNYASGTVQANLAQGSSNAQGQTSLQTTSTSAATGQSLTIGGSAGVLAVNTALSNSSILSNTSAQRIGSYTVQAGSAEGLTINSATLSFPLDSNGTVVANGINTMMETATQSGGSFTATPVYSGNYLNNLKLVISNCSGSTYTANPVNPQQTNTFSLSCNVAANSTATIDVYADPGNSTGTITTNLSLQVQGQSSHNSATLTPGSNGQKVTVGTGSIAEPTLGASAAVSALVASATQPTQGPATTAAFNFVSSVGTSTVQEMWVGVYTPTGTTVITGTAPVTQITVSGPGANGTTSTATAPVVNGVAHITGLSIQIPQGAAGQDISVQPTFNFVGVNGLTTGTGVRFGVTEYKYQSGQSTVDHTVTSMSYSNPMVVVASYPTVANSNGIVGVSSGATFGAGQQILQFTISANSSGPVRVKQIAVTPYYSAQTGDNFGTVGTAAGSSGTVKIYNTANPSVILNGTNGQQFLNMASGTQLALVFNTDEVIAAGTSKTYTVTVDTTGLTKTGDSFRLDLTNSGETYTAVGAAAANEWAWNDSTVSGTYLNGYLVQNLPVTGPTFVK